MKDRIQTIMDYYNLSKTEFGESIGVQPSAIHHLLSGRNEPSTRVLKAILEKFPEIDTNWFIFGNGEMLKNKAQPPKTEVFSTQKAQIQPQMPDLFGNNVANVPKKAPQTVVKNEPQGFPVANVENIEPQVIKTKPQVQASQTPFPQTEKRLVKKITIYYTDGTYEEYDVSPRS